MSRTGRVMSGVGIGYLSQALVTIVGLWLTPYLLRHLGQGTYGLWLVALQLTGYLSLLDLGVVALLPREVSYAVGRAGNRHEVPGLSDLIGTTLAVVLRQLPVVIAGGALAWWFLPDAWQVLRGPCAAIIALYIVLFPLRVFQAVLQGLQDLAFVGIVYISCWVLGTIVTVILVFSTNLGLYAIAIGWAVTQLLSAGLWLLRLRTRFPTALPSSLPTVSWAIVRATIGSGSWASVSQVAQMFLQGTDLILIARVVGPAAVVPYSITKKLLDVFANQPQMIMQSAMPALSEVKAAGGREQLQQVTGALTQAMLLASGAVCVVVLAVNRGFVTWWVGQSQFGGSQLTILLLSLMLLRHWNTTAVYATFCFGHQRRISLTTLADGAVTVLASAALATVLGPVGVVIGSLIGVSLISLPSNLSALARETGMSTTTLVGSLFPWFGRFAVLAVASSFAASRWVPTSFLALAATSAAVVFAYVVVMVPLLLRPPLGVYVRQRLPFFFAPRLQVVTHGTGNR